MSINTTFQSPLLRHTFVVATFVIMVIAAAAQPVEARASLRLYPDSDDPRQGGHVVDTGSFTLIVENPSTGGNSDNTAYDVFLVFSVKDADLLTGGSLLLPGGANVALDAAALQFGTPTQPCSGRTAPPHSIYPSLFTTIALGDIGGGESISIAVDIAGSDGLEAHFDAIGIGYKEAGRNIKCYDVINPSGHDVDVVFGGDEPPGNCDGLEISKETSSTGINIGDEIEYLITVDNGGTCDLTEVVVIDEIPTVTTDQGEAAAFTVLSADPPPVNQSDLELIWEIPALAPGEAITITLTVIFDEPAADQSHVVNLVCAFAAELEHRRCDTSTVAVGDVADEIGGPGFWCNQIRFALEGRDNAKFTVDELEAWLEEINEASEVFSEMWDVSVLELAQDLLCSPNLAEGPSDRLARHLLTLLFNVTSSRLDPELTLGELCPGSVEAPADMDPSMTIAEVIENAEKALLDESDDLEAWSELIDFINNAHPAGENGCGQTRRGRGGRR